MKTFVHLELATSCLNIGRKMAFGMSPALGVGFRCFEADVGGIRYEAKKTIHGITGVEVGDKTA